MEPALLVVATKCNNNNKHRCTSKKNNNKKNKYKKKNNNWLAEWGKYAFPIFLCAKQKRKPDLTTRTPASFIKPGCLLYAP